MESQEPVRWRDDPRGELPPALQRAFAAYQHSGPSADQLTRMIERSRDAAIRGAQPQLGLKLPWAVSGAVVAVVALLAVWFVPKRVAHVSNRAPAPLQVAPQPEPPVAAPLPEATPASAEVQAPAKPTRVRARRAATLTPSRPATDPASELRLLTPARRLMATRPTDVLAYVAEHARAYPEGAFTEERMALHVEALARLGRTQEAMLHARRFEKRYPSSPYVERLREVLHQP